MKSTLRALAPDVKAQSAPCRLPAWRLSLIHIYGVGKSGEVPEAIRKGEGAAKKNMHKVAMKGTTIPHEIVGVYGRCV